MSGSIYALAADVYYIDLERSLDRAGAGCARACADDVGAIARGRRALRQMARVFSLAAKFSNLVLQEKKCVAVGLGTETEAELRQILEEVAAAWKDFAIADAMLYLGCLIGPGASLHDNWSGPLSKVRLRGRAIGRSGADVESAARLYQQRATPVVGYKAQLFPLG